MYDKSNSQSIIWNEETMSIDNGLIDSQHKKLIDLINKLIYSIKNCSQFEDIEFIVEEAIEYANYHFETEEKKFKVLSLNSAEVEKHIEEHNKFKEIMVSYHSKLKKNSYYKTNHGIEISNNMFKYLIGWLNHHIRVEDRKLLIPND